MGENSDPYEQRLMAVFKSCLTNGQTELEEDAWCSLCNKLQLDEYSDTLKSCIQKSEKQSISYEEFRDALLMLLGKQEIITVSDELILNSQQDMKILNTSNRECGTVQPQNCNSQPDFQKMKTCAMPEKDEIRNLCDKLNTCLNEESSEMMCLSNCLGIPTLPKQVVQRMFEKLDGNCDGLIDLNEFSVIFENHKTLLEQASLEWNHEFRRNLSKPNSEENIFHMLGPHHTGFVQRCSVIEMWKMAGIPDAASMLTDLHLVSPEIRLTDLMTALSNEIKGLGDLSDHASIHVHINLLRGALVLYQEELRNLNVLVKNLGGERDKLRSDIAEANERANSLAQEIDHHHARQDELRQDLLKKVEQRYSETIKDLSMQLTSEQEASATAVKAKEQQLEELQQENNQYKTQLLRAFKENHGLEGENENLRERISTLQTANTELLNQLKILEAEHDEANSSEIAEQSEILQLMERIKKLQSEMVLLRDQNDELTVELEIYKSRNNHMSSTRHDSLLINSERDLDTEESRESVSDKSLGDHSIVAKNSLKHVHSISCDSLSEKSTEQNLNHVRPADCSAVVVKELRNILTRASDCSSKNCAFRNGISNIIGRIESESQSQPSNKQCDVAKSLASELETECQQKVAEQLRNFVSKSEVSKRPAPPCVKNNTKTTNIDDNFSSTDSKSTSSNKSLRDYPPRKEENSFTDLQKSTNSVNDDNTKNNSNCNSDENNGRMDFLNISFQEQEAKHTAEKEKLVERCEELERTLDLLRVEYDECEDYWALKLEEERQLFEQEQKISDEKFSELIAKIEEYEELLKPEDKSKSDGRLSPIEEKFNLEQQYTDLEDEFHKYKVKVEEDLTQKDKEIEKLNDTINSVEIVSKSDISVQVPDESALSVTSNISFTTMSPLAQPFTMKTNEYDIEAQKLYDSFKLDDISETSDSTNDFVPHAIKTEDIVDGYGLGQFRPVGSMSSMHSMHHSNQFSPVHSKLPENDTIPLCFSKENSMHNANYASFFEEKHKSTEEILKLRNARSFNESCMQTNPQDGPHDADASLIQALQKKLRSQERKMRKMQEVFKRRQYRLEQALHNTWAQHNVQTSELQYLLCATQEKLQLQIQVTEEQTKKLARADILAQNLYVENACLMANVKRLEERCRMLT